MESDKNGHRTITGSISTTAASAEDTIMTSTTSTPTTATTTNNTTNANDTVTSTTTKAITMDGYHQLQQKRALERQREQEKQKKHQKTSGASTPSTITMHPQPGPGQPQLSDDPKQAIEKAISSTSTEASAGASSKAGAATTSTNGLHHHPHHRKASSSQAPRTTSPPTPVSGGSVSTPVHKSTGPKGPKAIHAIELIRIAGEILQFPPATIGTSLVYYHKYRAYLHQAYKRGERDNEATKADEYLFATACLHLACKCTEVSRKVRDLVNVTYRVMNPNQPVLSLSTATKPAEDNSTTLDSIPPLSNNQQLPLTYPTAPPPTAQTYWTIRDSLLTTELMLLRILQFDLDVALPFSDVLRIYKGMGMVFAPTDEEASQLYPDASNFDVFLPSLHQQHHHGHSGSSSSTPNKHNTPSSTSSSTLLSSLPNSGSLAPHMGIHPTLSALVQISITFCIDALCSSTIALNSSSRSLAMGAIYLAIRSAGLELPLSFEDWCYAWGRPMIAAGFGVPVPGGSGSGSGSGGGGPGGSGVYGMGPGGSIAGSSTGGAGGVSGGVGMNGLLGLAATNLFVSSPRQQQGEGGFMEVELSSEAVGGGSLGGGGVSGSSGAGSGGLNGYDSIYSQSDSPQLLSNTLSPAALPTGFVDGLDGALTQPPQPMTIVDEVRKVVQELGSFYTH
ncbi:hypothetical protein MVEG_06155 [Podila verticillata NRRL 6337]|nr:hypothetical protein MVEG_06155 [Podila verticillata NRRL 6337]